MKGFFGQHSEIFHISGYNHIGQLGWELLRIAGNFNLTELLVTRVISPRILDFDMIWELVNRTTAAVEKIKRARPIHIHRERKCFLTGPALFQKTRLWPASANPSDHPSLFHLKKAGLFPIRIFIQHFKNMINIIHKSYHWRKRVSIRSNTYFFIGSNTYKINFCM